MVDQGRRGPTTAKGFQVILPGSGNTDGDGTHRLLTVDPEDVIDINIQGMDGKGIFLGKGALIFKFGADEPQQPVRLIERAEIVIEIVTGEKMAVKDRIFVCPVSIESKD